MTATHAREYIAAALEDTTGIGPAVLAYAGLQAGKTPTDAEAVAIVTKARNGIALAIEQTDSGISAKWEF
jgi:hypothetical protein